MNNKGRDRHVNIAFVVAVFALTLGISAVSLSSGRGESIQNPWELSEYDLKVKTVDAISGPFEGRLIGPAVYNGDLRDKPVTENKVPALPKPLRAVPGQEPKGSAPQVANWIDPVVQNSFGIGLMPDPISDFAGLDFVNWGSGWPPDTNGDVGPSHYIQVVNTSIGIYDKATGTRLYAATFNNFFSGPAGTPCDNNHQGDPIVLYDASVDRWVVTDFAWSNINTGPFYECIAVSQTENPLGGWHYYALQASDNVGGTFYGYLNDYPKLGVWQDGWYMTANMFEEVGSGSGFGVRVWALNKSEMIAGLPASEVHFDLTYPGYSSLLPANLRGDDPPFGAPNYLVSVEANNKLHLWEFDVDWTTPSNSTFTGPTTLPIADFTIAPSIPQPGTTQLLDSLSFRLMMQLQYRNINGVESLWANHSVATGGVVGVRWYEIGNPGGTPVLLQQGTYQPDDHYRWMGSLAVDGDGNMAIGYSASSTSLYPSIRYAGRLAGETPGMLPQSEVELTPGGGSQIGINRWGDYSTMTIDPVDDCTFWYTTEYLQSTGFFWVTRIGSFKYPSCGQPKAYINGIVSDAISGDPVQGVSVTAQGASQTLSVSTDASGYYTMTLLAGSYAVSAGPLLPGYPSTDSASNIIAVTGATSTQNFSLNPAPSLVGAGVLIDDLVSGGNGNGAPEPGEQGLLLYRGLENIGATSATNVSASVFSASPGVSLSKDPVSYADVPVGAIITNSVPYTFTISNIIACGSDLNFQQIVTDSVTTYTLDFNLNAAQALPRTNAFSNDVESGADGWMSAGTGNQWTITTLSAHSPTHAWTDSPSGNYADNVNNYLRTPAYDLSGVRNVQISGWYTYALEAGYDYVYLEYSLNGGSSWAADPLGFFNGYEPNWTYSTIDASILDGQSNVALRYRLVSDAGVNDEGIFLDDIVLSYEPYECHFDTSVSPDTPILLSPLDGSTVSNPVLFDWDQAATGGTAQEYILTIDTTDTYTVSGESAVSLNLDDGLHSWTVQAINIAGSSPESEPWEVNVANPPGAPNLVAPPNGATIPDADTMIEFEWTPGLGGGETAGYYLYIDGSRVVTTTSVMTSTGMTLSTGVHSWYVVAFNTIGESIPSETRTLEVLPDLPGTPTLITPPTGSFQTNPVAFAWKASNTGGPTAGYEFVLDGSPVITFTAPITETQLILNSGEHTWTVIASNAAGQSEPAPVRSLFVVYNLYLPHIFRNSP